MEYPKHKCEAIVIIRKRIPSVMCCGICGRDM